MSLQQLIEKHKLKVTDDIEFMLLKNETTNIKIMYNSNMMEINDKVYYTSTMIWKNIIPLSIYTLIDSELSRQKTKKIKINK